MKSWIAPTGDWCNLCKQPFGSWFEHVSGRFKDHRAMEIIYNSYIEQGYRKWAPADLYTAVGLDKYFHLRGGKDTVTHTQHTTDIQRSFASSESLKGVFLPFYSTFTAIEHDMKRRFYHIMKFMYTNGHLRAFLTTDVLHLKGIDMIGSRIMYYQLAKPLLRCFPKADSGQLSTFHHIAFDPYNLESTYDILCLQDIFDEVCSRDHRSKGFTIRLLFADFHHICTGIVPKSEGIRQLAEFALMALTAEVIMGKMMEYCLRVDRVWREMKCNIDTENVVDSDEGIYKKRFQLIFDRKEGEMKFI